MLKRLTGVSGTALAVALTGAIVLTGCEPLNVRQEHAIPSARTAAERAVLIEPGHPPDMASPSDVVILERLRRRAAERRARAARLRIDNATRENDADIWARIRSGMTFREVDHPTVEAELSWYAGRPEYIQRMTDRARLYLGYIVHEAQRRQLPLELTLLPVVESAFQPYARSPAGAMGIWQFIRSTGRHYGLKQNSWSDARRDIVQSTRAAFDYLQKLHNDMDGDWLLAVAAYNAGEGNVLRAVRKNKKRGKPFDFFSLSLPAETRAYVPRLLAIAKLVARPDAYDIELDAIDSAPYFDQVQVDTEINLAKAAEMAGITLNELMLLNPAFMRETTGPGGPHNLLVPVDSVALFREALAATPPDQRIAWSHVQVTRGDTLSAIAAQHDVSVHHLREVNELSSNTLQIGQQLRIPGRSGTAPAPQKLSKEVRRGMELARRNEQRTTYRVRTGDSLWSIARKHKVSVERLRQWNGLRKAKVLRTGQTLVIWRRGSMQKPPSKTRAYAKNSTEHVVKNGDNLWSIARRYQLKTSDLVRWNGIKINTPLQPGQKLRLLPPNSA